MEYKIKITSKEWNTEFSRIIKRIDVAIDYFWFFVEDCPSHQIYFYKNGVDITPEILKNQTLKNKYYKGRG